MTAIRPRPVRAAAWQFRAAAARWRGHRRRRLQALRRAHRRVQAHLDACRPAPPGPGPQGADRAGSAGAAPGLRADLPDHRLPPARSRGPLSAARLHRAVRHERSTPRCRASCRSRSTWAGAPSWPAPPWPSGAAMRHLFWRAMPQPHPARAHAGPARGPRPPQFPQPPARPAKGDYSHYRVVPARYTRRAPWAPCSRWS
jgi:hypothetical protein